MDYGQPDSRHAAEQAAKTQPQNGSMKSPERSSRNGLIGLDVLFTPPQDCKGKTTLDYYPAKIVKVNPRSNEFGNVETVELVTFGPNSLYFQHNVPMSHDLTPGHWCFR